MIWTPIAGHADLERALDGRVRRIPTVGGPLNPKPHPTKRVLLSDEEVAALGLGGGMSGGPASSMLSPDSIPERNPKAGRRSP